MVVKVSVTNSSSSLQRTAKRVVKKYRKNGHQHPTSSDLTFYHRLQQIVPTICEKENISKLDVVLEAISYIQTLQGNLQLAPGQAVPTLSRKSQAES